MVNLNLKFLVLITSFNVFMGLRTFVIINANIMPIKRPIKIYYQSLDYVTAYYTSKKVNIRAMIL